jgi:uncharacterized membrane protein YsdA (DUF1294 family)
MAGLSTVRFQLARRAICVGEFARQSGSEMLKQARLKIPDSFAAVWFAAFSMATFLAFGFDKWRAGRAGQRVSELTLAMLGALGGWPGGFAGHDGVPAQDRQMDFQVQICPRADSFRCRSLGLVTLALNFFAASVRLHFNSARRVQIRKCWRKDKRQFPSAAAEGRLRLQI